MLICYLLGGCAGVLATFVTQASVIEGYAVGVAWLLAGLYGIWRLEHTPTHCMPETDISNVLRAA